jgi:hypothetical protein
MKGFTFTVRIEPPPGAEALVQTWHVGAMDAGTAERLFRASQHATDGTVTFRGELSPSDVAYHDLKDGDIK